MFPTGNTTLTNTAVATSPDEPECATCVPTPPTTTVNAGPDLVTTKTVDKATANPGDVVTYTITVTNQDTATAAASNIDITDTVPAATLAHLTALTAQDGGSASLATGTANWPTVASWAPGASATVHLQATLATVFPVGTTTLTNTVVAASPDEPECATCVPTPPTTTVNAGPDLVTTKTVDKATGQPGRTW